MAGKALVMLDRDGTIIVERNRLTDPDDVELLPNAAAGIARLRSWGFPVVIVTNQAVIGRGAIDEARLGVIHDRLRKLLAEAGAQVDGIFVCPHRPEDGCLCRKPAPGLLQAAARAHAADLGASFMVGDKQSDLEAGQRAGARCLLVRTGYGEETLAALGSAWPGVVVDDLREAADWIGNAGQRSVERKRPAR